MRVAITNGVGTYNVTQVGLSGGNCIPVIYSMSDGIFWSEVSVAIQNDLDVYKRQVQMWRLTMDKLQEHIVQNWLTYYKQ